MKHLLEVLRIAALAIVLCISTAAHAGERLAVFVIAGDVELADNLTEVVIAKLSAQGRELVGGPELRARLTATGVVTAGGLDSCLRDKDCLSEVAAAVGVEHVVIGRVEEHDDGFVLTLELVATPISGSIRTVTKSAPHDTDALISAVQAAALELGAGLGARPPEEPARSPAAVTPPPAASPNRDARHAGAAAAPAEKPARSPVIRAVGYGAGLAALVSLSAAFVLGSMAEGTPTGNSREEAQQDLERRGHDATLANGAYVAAGVFSAVSITAFVVSW